MSNSRNVPRIVLVTGAGSGIGRAVAQCFYHEGYAVVAAGRHLPRLQETFHSVASTDDPRILIVPTDVTCAEQVDLLFQSIQNRFGRLDVLFNNAGTNVMASSLEEVTPEQWRAVVDVNLSGVFYCTRAAFRIMKDQTPMGRRIINNGSISAQSPRPNSAPYTATKHAITGLTKSTALDGRRYNIACGQIDIGNADTNMASRMKAGILQADGDIAVEPTMDVEHVAQAVLHMASLPLESNILSMTIMATKMPLVGRG